ncbi:AAA family ATPase [Candidatus Midichloria mitochondrii]|uniref:Putative DNA polymerase III delta prime subunit DnaC n=1 Tax=Midichloria mitochondrii (strain IricVA) TaxID=696127 RepID=F7XW53_MIDMI|nr:AAA family ATPase [Candidatus Midichloria mitochondrii]AEI88902.1 putative DNA polymerase III delta prime subunit DnaC [Candidatus Midichloria mitochondrii IricVA]
MNIQLLANVIGHEKGKKILINAFQNNKLSHSYILSGPKGIGKYLLAVEFSKTLLNNKSRQASPDLMVIQSTTENKKHSSININEIQELESFLRFTSANNSYRIGIVDGVEYMNYSAANALLKILEEPGNKTIIF